ALQLAPRSAVEQGVVGKAGRSQHAQAGSGAVGPGGSDTLGVFAGGIGDHLQPLVMVSDHEGLTPPIAVVKRRRHDDPIAEYPIGQHRAPLSPYTVVDRRLSMVIRPPASR